MTQAIQAAAKTPEERIMEVLDRDNPKWEIAWASDRDLSDFTADAIGDGVGQAREILRKRVARRLIGPILNAALSAEIIALVD